MLEIIIDLIRIIIVIFSVLVIVYSLARLTSIAWHKTKKEYDSRLFEDEEFPNRNHQNDEEL